MILVTSCGSKKTIVTKKKRPSKTVVSRENTKSEPEVQDENHQDQKPLNLDNPTEAYIATYSKIAQDEMRQYGIPASITLAQGILESGSGNGRLSKEANNHFGIKCHGWTGAKIYHDDDASQECFRKYKDAKYSFRDHSLFLTGRSRYSKLFDLRIDDYEGWAKGLRAAGYATDKKYPQKLISLIERYQLYTYDQEVLVSQVPARVDASDPARQYIVKKGDTLYSISRRHSVSIEEIQKLNGIDGTNLQIGQIIKLK